MREVKCISSIFFLAIPLGIAAITHLLNPIGFLGMHVDEGTYMDRIMRILEGEGPKEPLHYDHPYFGQLFMAAALQAVGYPDSLHSIAGHVPSIETLILVPRFLVGILFVIDTFLVYKIAEHRYNWKVAFIASVMFVIAPMASTLTRILLDNILLPFLLSSILFAFASSNTNISKKHNDNIQINREKNTLIILISGIFLGLAIFTKIPAFTFIPVVGYLVFTNSNRNWKTLGVWLIPVIVIPAIWPVHSMAMGQFDGWLSAILWQTTGRADSSLPWTLFKVLFEIDPLFLVLGMVGVLYAVIKRDFFIILGTIPFLAFLYFIGYVKGFHFAPLLPLLSIAFAVLLVHLTGRISSNNGVYKKILPFAIISVIGIFQLATVAIPLGMNANDTYFRVIAFASELIPDYNSNNDRNKIAVIGSPNYLWIPKYVFDKDQNDYIHFNSNRSIETDSILLVVDNGFKKTFSRDDKRVGRNQMLYDNSTMIGLFDDTHHLGRTEVRTNFLNPALTTVVSSR
jgi:hypothetical protein